MLNFQNVLPVHLPMTLDVLKNTFLIFVPLHFFLTACSLSPNVCLTTVPVEYQACAPHTIIAQKQQTLSWTW